MDPTAVGGAWTNAILGAGTPMHETVEGQTFRLGDVIIQVLNPPTRPLTSIAAEVKNNGVVLRVVYGEVSSLLTAAIEASTERRLACSEHDPRNTVPKVAHHASDPSSS